MARDDKAEPLRIWALTTGEAGMRTQARALAHAIGGQVEEKVVRLGAPWRYLPAATPGFLGAVEPTGAVAPPWPDVIVSCGRRSALIARAAKRASGGRTAIVHVQDPRAGRGDFDLIVAMEHDDARGANVVRVMTALNDVTPERLAAGADAWRDRFAALPRPLTAVILGGPAGATPFGPPEARLLLDLVRRLRAREAGGIVVVPSRRTPDEVLALFLDEARSTPGVWAWDRQGDNPYFGALALADRLVVTGDSVSMVSEALATPHPVEIFVASARKRHESFHSALLAGGLVRQFDGEPTAAAPRTPLNVTQDAAEAVRRMLVARAA